MSSNDNHNKGSPPQTKIVQVPVARDDPKSLRRSILKLAIDGRESTRKTQTELNRQQELLEKSLGEAQRAANEARDTRQQIGQLKREQYAGGNLNKVSFCCLMSLRFLFRCKCCDRLLCRSGDGDAEVDEPRVKVDDAKYTGSPRFQIWTSKPKVSRGHDESGDHQVTLGGFRRALADDRSWRRTLEPRSDMVGESSPGASDNSIWLRQVDLCLTELQQMANEMGESLDEQTKLTDALTIYLDQGVDQMMYANQSLLKMTN